VTTTPTNDRRWTFLTNHGHVLVALSRAPDVRIRDLAATVGITERATQNILADLEAAGYVTRQREGRRNRYQLHPDRRFRHPAEAGHEVGELLALFTVEAPVPE
jgi:predicted ArsR family transcriptional regulator